MGTPMFENKTLILIEGSSKNKNHPKLGETNVG
jgi:hypothetical protein